MRLKLFAIALPSLLFSTIDEGFLPQKEKCSAPLKKECECIVPRIEMISEENAFCKWQGRSQSATVDKGVVVSGNYLYWQAKEDGLEYLQTVNLNGAGSTQLLVRAELFEPDSSWNSGFRVALGYIFPARSQWDVRLDWTSFHSHAGNRQSSSDPTLATEMLRPTWLPFLMGTGATQGSVDWTLRYNILNLSLGRDFFLGKWMSFHPQMGITGGWIKQHYHANYEGFSALNGVFSPVGPTNYLADWEYRAVGLRLGTDVQWYMTSQVSLVANGFASILCGKYQLNEKFNGAFPIGFFTLIHEKIMLKDNFYRLRPAIEMEIGARWQHFFSDKMRRVLFGAYYGFAYWFQQNIMVNEFVILDQNFNSFLTNLPTTGDLQLQGLRIEAEINF